MAGKKDNGQSAGAMDKLRDELAKTIDPAARMLGELLTALLPGHPEWESAMTVAGKTLKGAWDAVYDEAKKRHVTCMADAETLAIAMSYYGLTGDAAALMDEYGAIRYAGLQTNRGQETGNGEPEAAAEESPAQDAVDLDALLGGL